jgi:hypothetical protein
MTTYYKQYQENNTQYPENKVVKLVLYDKNNNGERIKEKKYIQSNDISLDELINLLKTPLKIIVNTKDESDRLTIDNAPVDGFVYDLTYVEYYESFNDNGNNRKYLVPKFNVKKIGLWDMVGHVDGPMDLLNLKKKYNIYKDIYSGGKTRRRRRAKKASRKSRRNRKR